MDTIERGYIRIARQICQSAIWERPHHYLKIWLWLLVQANWKPYGDLDRGEVLVTQRDMDAATRTLAGTSFRYLTRAQIRHAFAWFESEGMILTRRYRGGIVVKVVNYERFQDVSTGSLAEILLPPPPPPAALEIAAPPAPDPAQPPLNAKRKRAPVPDVTSEDWGMACEILDELNHLSGKRFKPVKGTLSHILARIREIDPVTKQRVYGREDFALVLRFKIKDDWFRRDNGRFYNPATLFRMEKFPAYLEEARVANEPPKPMPLSAASNQATLDQLIAD